MPKATSVLFGIEDEFDVVSVDRADSGQVKIIIEMLSREGPCPGCGVFSRRVKDRSLVRIQDLRACGQRVQLWWRKRRLVCLEALCRRRSFTQESRAIRPRARVTERLREQVARAIASSNRAVSDVAAEYGVSWRTAHKALVAAAASWVGVRRGQRRSSCDGHLRCPSGGRSTLSSPQRRRGLAAIGGSAGCDRWRSAGQLGSVRGCAVRPGTGPDMIRHCAYLLD